MEEMILKGLAWAMEKSPMVVGVLASMTIVQSINKLLMTFIGEIVLVTPSNKDNELYQKLLNSNFYKSLVWLIDFTLRLKIKK